MLYQKYIRPLLHYKEWLTTLALVLLCLFLFYAFPAQGIFQDATAALFFFFIIPALYIKLILKKDFSSCGFRLGEIKTGILLACLSFAGSLLVLYVLLNYTAFPKNYSLPLLVRQNFWFFVFYEIIISGAFFALYEFFFRGFFMFSFPEKFRPASPLAQFFLLVFFFLATGNFIWQNSFFLITSFFAGWTANNSRSLIYSFLSALAFSIAADAMIIKLFF